VTARVTFRHEYLAPVVVAFIAALTYESDGTCGSVEVRVANVLGTGCDIFMETPDDLSHANETVCYLVVETGQHVSCDGWKIEAGTVSTSSVHREYDPFGGEFVSLGVAFEDVPGVLHSLSTYNNADFMSTVVHSVSLDGFMVQQEAVRADSYAATEVIGWVAFERGTFTFMEGGRGSDGKDDGFDPLSLNDDDPVTPHLFSFQKQFSTK